MPSPSIFREPVAITSHPEQDVEAGRLTGTSVLRPGGSSLTSSPPAPRWPQRPRRWARRRSTVGARSLLALQGFPGARPRLVQPQPLAIRTTRSARPRNRVRRSVHCASTTSVINDNSSNGTCSPLVDLITSTRTRFIKRRSCRKGREARMSVRDGYNSTIAWAIKIDAGCCGCLCRHLTDVGGQLLHCSGQLPVPIPG